MAEETLESLTIRLALCRRQLATTKEPLTRDVLHVMIENLEARLEALGESGSRAKPSARPSETD